MMKLRVILGLAVAAALVCAGCSKASVADLTRSNQNGGIICYSGGETVYKGNHIGRVNISGDGRIHTFVAATPRKEILTVVTGDCVVRYE